MCYTGVLVWRAFCFWSYLIQCKLKKTESQKGVYMKIVIRLRVIGLLLQVILVLSFIESPCTLGANNTPPEIENLFPQDGAVFDAPASVTLSARAGDAETGVRSVEFFQGNQSIGFRSDRAPIPGVEDTFSLSWTNVPAGIYSITAKATDLDGATTTSSAYTIKVSGPSAQPTVTVEPFSINTRESEPGQPAQFAIIRAGNKEQSLNVHYTVGGTAVSGLDFEPIPDTATIPAGESVAYISVVPIWDSILEPDETVTISLQESSLPVPRSADEDYSVGNPSSATVVINDVPPPVVIISLTVLRPAPVIKGTNVTLRAFVSHIPEAMWSRMFNSLLEIKILGQVARVRPEIIFMTWFGQMFQPGNLACGPLHSCTQP